MGQRTQRLGDVVLAHLRAGGIDDAKAIAVARDIAGVFGKVKDAKDDNPARTEQLTFISPEERRAALALADRALAGEKIDAQVVGLLRTTDTAADIALFGRMLADNPSYNREAAVQVAHAITTHRVTVEDDYYTAVDDLKIPAEDAGAGFLGEAWFGSGVFYLYLCVDQALLVRNLDGDTALASIALGALAEAAATVAPRGKQNSFAAHGRAGYVLAERGDQQPRTLAGAFAHPVNSGDLMATSIDKLRQFRSAIDKAYGPAADATIEMEVGGDRTLADILAFVREDLPCLAT
jgi:CRISPR system Cascade subunit CasC